MKKSSASRDPLEVEVKLAIQDVSKIRRKILKMGFRQEMPRALEQNWALDFDDQALRRKGQLLRLREYQNQGMMTFKGVALKSKRYKVRLELEIEVSNGKTLLRILDQLGLEARFRYEKYRSTFGPEKQNSRKPVVVTIDETPIGNYLEIEGSPKMINWIALQLGFSPKQYITKSYTELFFSSKLAKTQKHMVFDRRRTAK
jgi:adenylate cyclase class 2